MNRQLELVPFVAIDTETTGSSARKYGDRIIELAAVRFSVHGIEATWERMLWPHRPIQPGAQAVHGISSEDLQRAPCFNEVAGDFLDFVGDAVVVMHNAPFDCAFLAVHLAEAGYQWDPIVFDTLRLLRRNFQLPANNLSQALRSFGIPVMPTHRAAADAVATAHLFLHILQQLRSPSTLRDVVPFHGPANSLPQTALPSSAIMPTQPDEIVEIEYADRPRPLVGQIEGVACGEAAAYCTLRLLSGLRLHLRQDRILAVRLIA